MKRVVLMDENEWQRLPVVLADEMLRVLRRDGLRVLDESGQDMAGLRDYITGTLVIGLRDVTDATVIKATETPT